MSKEKTEKVKNKASAVKEKKAITKADEGRILTEADWKNETFLSDIRKGNGETRTVPQNMGRTDEKQKELLQALVEGNINKFRNDTKREEFIKQIFSELIGWAYQDRNFAYTWTPSNNNIDILHKLQNVRHKQDRHLIGIIQAFKNINREPVKITIKKADNVSIGDKTSTNIDKQLNITSNDLDKKKD
jgi:hypothetical protein